MKKLLKPLSEGDYCALEDLLNEEITFLNQERIRVENANYRKLCDAKTKQCKRLLKTLWKLSEWDR